MPATSPVMATAAPPRQPQKRPQRVRCSTASRCSTCRTSLDSARGARGLSRGLPGPAGPAALPGSGARTSTFSTSRWPRSPPVPGPCRADPPAAISAGCRLSGDGGDAHRDRSRGCCCRRGLASPAPSRKTRAELVRRLRWALKRVSFGALQLDELPRAGATSWWRRSTSSSRRWPNDSPTSAPTSARPGPTSCAAPDSPSTTASAASSRWCAST